MIEILLDNSHVIPRDGASIKLTASNPFFSSTDSFTYEVELPMRIAQNRAVFGCIERKDTAKSKRTFTAEIRLDNKTVLTGTAAVTSVTDTAVKVQLMGARATVNYRSETDSIYIDSLNLGAIDGGDYNRNPSADNATTGDRDNHASQAPTFPETATFTEPQGRWLRYPILNITTDLVTNNYVLWREGQDGKTYTLGLPVVTRDRADDDNWPRKRMAVQPKLWWIAELIATATDMTLDRQDNILYTDDFFNRIFIANSFPHYKIAALLPHWTVAEFWKNLERALGVTVVMNPEDTRMRIIPRQSYYTASAVRTVIDTVTDEYSVEIDDEENTDISANNVSYPTGSFNPCDLLDESVTGAARYDTSFADISDIISWAKAMPEFRLDNYRDTIFDCKDGRRYIIFKERLEGATAFMEVDQFRPRITDSSRDSDEVTLKFAPCSVYSHQLRVTQRDTILHRNVVLSDIDTVEVTVIGCPGRSDSVEYTNVLEDLINGEEASSGESDRPDVIYIALEGGYSSTAGEADGVAYSFQWPDPMGRPLTWWRIDEEQPVEINERLSLSLNRMEGQTNLYDKTVGSSAKIDTTVRYCFQFLTNKIIEPEGVFSILNRLYVCEKIEYSLKNDSLEKMATGYFYPVEL